MPQIQNSSTIKEIRSISGSSIAEGFAQRVNGNEVQLVANVNPKDYRVTNICATATATATGSFGIYATSATKLTYITGFHLSLIKDATCDMTTGFYNLNVQINNVAKYLVRIPVIALTAQQITVSLTLANPLLIDKNYTITADNGAYTVGVAVRSATVFGFEVEPFEN